MEGNPLPPPVAKEASTTPPPVAFANYPRQGDAMVYGTSEKLIGLFKGYHGMSYAFLWVVVSAIALICGLAMLERVTTPGMILILLAIVALVLALYASVKSSLQICWASGSPPLLGWFLGLSAPFLGIIMISVIQYLALNEMKQYGLKGGFFGAPKKKDVIECVEWLQKNEGKPVTGLAAIK